MNSEIDDSDSQKRQADVTLFRESKIQKLGVGDDEEDEEDEYDEDFIKTAISSIDLKEFIVGLPVPMKTQNLLGTFNPSFKNFKRYFMEILCHCSLRGLNQKIHQDEDRDVFLSRVITLLYKLRTRELVGNGHYLLTLGPKGTGKSSILEAAVKTSRLLTSTISIYLDCSIYLGSDEISCPSTIIWRYITDLRNHSSFLPHELTLDTLIVFLYENNLSVFVCFDEFHSSYALPSFTPFRKEVYNMIQNRNGLFVVVVAGSSPYLRALCYGKFPMNDSVISKFKG